MRNWRLPGRLGMPAMALAIAMSGCETSTSPRVPTELRLDRGTVTLDDGATTQLVATLLDQDGDTLAIPAGQTVLWTSGTELVATVDQTGTVTARAPGTATIRAVLGDLVGESTVTVRQVATEIRFNTPQDWDGYAREDLPEILVAVVDRHGIGVSGLAVTFEVVEGGGTVAPATMVTDQGVARTTWRLGPPGPQRLRATAAVPNSPVELRANAVQGPAARVEIVSGNNQTGPAGAELPEPLAVRVYDRHGFVLTNWPVQWDDLGRSEAQGDGPTDGTGVATARWRLGNAAGEYEVIAFAGKGATARFTATATPP